MGGAGWRRTVYIVCFTQFVAQAGNGLVIPFLPFYVKELGAHGTGEVALLTGLSATASGAAQFLVSPIWGSLADRFGRKLLLLRAYFGLSISMVLQGLAQSVPQLILLRGIQGAFVGTIPAAAALVGATSPVERVPQSMGLLQTAAFLASTTGPLMGGVLADVVGIRQAFLVSGVFSGMSGLLLIFFVKENFKPPETKRGPLASLTQGMRDVAASRPLMIMIGIIFLISVSSSLGRPLIPLLVEALDPTGNAKRETSYVLATMAVMSACAALVVGNLAPRVGCRILLIIALTGAGFAYLPVAGATGMFSLLALLAFVGLFSGGMVPAANALLSLNAPAEKQGSTFGVAWSANSLSQTIAPLMGGVLASLMGIRGVYVVSGCATLFVASLVFIAVREPAKREAAEAGQPDVAPA